MRPPSPSSRSLVLSVFASYSWMPVISNTLGFDRVTTTSGPAEAFPIASALTGLVIGFAVVSSRSSVFRSQRWITFAPGRRTMSLSRPAAKWASSSGIGRYFTTFAAAVSNTASFRSRGR